MKKLFPFLISIFISFAVFGQKTDISAPSPSLPGHETDNNIWKVVQEMPRFYSEECEAIEDYKERKQCADKAMLEFIYKNLEYPALAIENKVQGRVVIAFVVEKDGKITNPKVVRGIGAGCLEEGLRLVNIMSELPDRWVPGKQRGKRVRVRFNLPFKFKLPKEKKAIVFEEEPQFINQAVEEEDHEIFKVVEEMPRFYNEECEAIEQDKKERKACANEAMLEFIYKNLEYPALAKENKVQGRVVITFVVEKDGKITTPKILRDIGADCGKEGLRLINLMNERPDRWIPGKQRGKQVRVQFNLPIAFKLKKKNK